MFQGNWPKSKVSPSLRDAVFWTSGNLNTWRFAAGQGRDCRLPKAVLHVQIQNSLTVSCIASM